MTGCPQPIWWLAIPSCIENTMSAVLLCHSSWIPQYKIHAYGWRTIWENGLVRDYAGYIVGGRCVWLRDCGYFLRITGLASPAIWGLSRGIDSLLKWFKGHAKPYNGNACEHSAPLLSLLPSNPLMSPSGGAVLLLVSSFYSHGLCYSNIGLMIKMWAWGEGFGRPTGVRGQLLAKWIGFIQVLPVSCRMSFQCIESLKDGTKSLMKHLWSNTIGDRRRVRIRVSKMEIVHARSVIIQSGFLLNSSSHSAKKESAFSSSSLRLLVLGGVGVPWTQETLDDVASGVLSRGVGALYGCTSLYIPLNAFASAKASVIVTRWIIWAKNLLYSRTWNRYSALPVSTLFLLYRSHFSVLFAVVRRQLRQDSL